MPRSTGMPPRKRPDPVESQLKELAALRHELDGALITTRLREALTNRHNLIVARAAKMTGELGQSELAEELIAAFDRLMVDPARLDKGCNGTRAIVEALVDLEIPTPEVFRRGMIHVQMEGAFGPPVDVAVELRANSAIGLSACGDSDVVVELVPLLVDKADLVRQAAARAIGASGRLAAEAVLKLKVLSGDEEPEVTVECLGALLKLAPERSLALAEPFLRSPDAGLRQATMLALGESRLDAAVELLIAHWPRELDREARRVLLLALATSRQEAAFAFLVELVAEGDLGTAVPAIDALALSLSDPKIEARLRDAIARSEHRPDLERHMEKLLGQQ